MTTQPSTTLGIDLASQNEKTAACILAWTATGAEIADLRLGRLLSGLDWLVELAAGREAIGIDAPFGWPVPMVDAVAAWAEGGPWADSEPRDLRLRLTDKRVWERKKITPLSVASDRIAIVAWRCAGLLTRLGAGAQLDRAGGSGVFEVYPAATLACWEIARAGYKARGRAQERAGQEARRRILEQLQERAPWLDLGSYEVLCVESDDALDALIAALAARAAQLGRTVEPLPDDVDLARVEGWIHLPRDNTLTALAAT